MSWLYKQCNIFNRQKIVPFIQKYQKSLLHSTYHDDDNNFDDDNYRSQFPYSTHPKKKPDEIQISKITLDDYQEAATRMNDFFWDNSLVKAFKIQKSYINQNVLYNMWLNHLHENLSLKSYYKDKPDKINGIIINSPHVQSHEYTELLDLADMAETKELQHYFIALANIVKKPKIYSEYSKILEVNGIGVDRNERKNGIAKKLLNSSLQLGLKRGFNQFRVDCTNCKEGDALFRYDWKPVMKIPFNQFEDIDDTMQNDQIKIYERSFRPPELEY